MKSQPYANGSGEFHRQASRFRNWVTKDGAPGPTGDGGFAAEANRYHLYVSLACPWAHRTLIMRRLKRLEDMISLSIVNWLMTQERGWTFDAGPCVVADPVLGAQTLRDIYRAAAPDYAARATVPVLWDKQRATIVSNESSEIIRMLSSAFDELGAAPGDYYPESLRAEIDAINDRVYRTVNNGVYRAGFATAQPKYEAAVTELFATLDWLEQRLAHADYLVGDRLTEADIRLFTTLIRFDSVYHGHFKCNVRRIVDYPALWRFTRRIYALPAVRETVNFEHIKNHYYQSHAHINPTGIVPVGPELDLELP
jgi:glutathionyl-hydroquinone reductase